MGDTKTVTDWRDFAERVLRAFCMGAFSAAMGLGLTEDIGADIVSVEHGWKPILVGGIVAALTAAKAAIFQGRGSNPEDGSAR